MSSPEKPTDPPTPCACSGDGEKKARFKPTRRDFLLAFGVGLNAVAGAMIGIPLLGYALSTAAKRYNLKPVSLGPLNDFPVGTTRFAEYKNPYTVDWDGEMAHIPVWVRHVESATSENVFQVFAINCTHLGCPVRWFAESKLFMCPCHGGAFYENGDHASGPPPRELYQYTNWVKDGQLWIEAGLQFTLGNKGTEGPKFTTEAPKAS
jgi:menaquinol-cytochrome c reductase iron-sulfur subunit